MLTSFQDPEILRGSGDNEDYPEGLPKGSKYRNITICGAITTKGSPCCNKPIEDGRCAHHTGKSNKKTKPFYSRFYTPDEIKKLNEIKVGDLEDEIRLFKTILQREVVKDYNIKELTMLAKCITDLEIQHYTLKGNRVDESEAYVKLRFVAEETDKSIVPVIGEVSNVPDTIT